MPPSEPAAQYPIRTVALRTGLSAHVIRAWERRYGAVAPGRGPGGARLYTGDDVRRLGLLRRLAEMGHPIGRVAGLETPALEALLRHEGGAPALPAGGAPAPQEGGPTEQAVVAAALEAVEALDARALHALLVRAALALPSAAFTEGVVTPLLARVGELWARDRLCPAHEHLLSVQVLRVLGWLLDSLPAGAGAPEAVAVTPAGQRHEIGALLAAVVAAEEGWRVTYLGADLPAADIATAVRTRRARAVLLSAVLAEGAGPLAAEVRRIRAAAGEETRILVGGAAAGEAASAVERAGGTWLRGLGELRAALRDLGAEGEDG